MKAVQFVGLVVFLVVGLPQGLADNNAKKTFVMDMEQGVVRQPGGDPRSLMLPTNTFQSPVRFYRLVAESSLIFLGEIVDVKLDRKRNVRLIKFKTKKVWRGPLKEFLVLESGPPGDMCAIHMNKGARYIVYAEGSPPFLNCGRQVTAGGLYEDPHRFEEFDISKQADVETVGFGADVTLENIDSIKARVKERESQLRAERAAKKKDESVLAPSATKP